MKQKKKGKNYAVFYFTGERFFFYIYDVIVKQTKRKRSANHYLCVGVGVGVCARICITHTHTHTYSCRLKSEEEDSSKRSSFMEERHALGNIYDIFIEALRSPQQEVIVQGLTNLSSIK